MDQDTYNQLVAYNKAARRHKLAKTGQVMGGTGRLMATGDASSFQKLAPQYDTLSPLEKAAMIQKLNAEQAQQEQFYYGKAQDLAVKEFQERQQNRRSALQAEVSRYSTSSSNARQAAQLKLTQANTELARIERDMAQMTSPSAGVAAEIEAIEKNADQAVVRGTADPITGAVVGGTDPRLAREEAYKAAAPGLIARAMASNNPADIVAVIDRLASVAGKSPEEVASSLGGPDLLDRYGADSVRITGEMKMLEEQADRATERATSAPREAWGSGKASGAMAQDLAGRQEKPTTTRMLAQQLGLAPQAAPEAVPPGVDPEGVEMQMAETEFLGLPIKPATSSYDRAQQLIGIIEDYPEYPPAEMAKRTIMDSEDFKKYKAQRGYQDDEFAFKEMAREAKVKQRETKREDRATRRENVKLGAAPGRIPTSPRKPPNSVK